MLGSLVIVLLALMPVAASAVVPVIGTPPTPPPPPHMDFAWVEASYRCGQVSPLQFKHLELPDQDLSTVLDIHVDEEGSIEKIVLTSSSGLPAFDQAALQMVNEWLYRPKIQHGQRWVDQVRLRVDMIRDVDQVSITSISNFDGRISKLRLEPCY